ncbi:AraC family transcriptional regulator [Labrenzia polysiphoniae]|uniref:AraC family transcriptional regulator n=1 Tax=Roseibium polysiphoniae TaxID=2571221 RepID=A0ABR9C8A5_9HYPH|nr:AraC family transcriptional regulator [Roseibium polysiphoniae]
MTDQNRETPGAIGGQAGHSSLFQSVPIEDASSQAALQPWVKMECYQLSRGTPVAHFDCLDLGTQQIVRECQHVSVQKIGCTPSDFCTVSISTEGPTTRFSEHCGAHENSVFFLPANAEFDVHVPAGSETAYIGFSQTAFLQGARTLNPALWSEPPANVLPLATNRRADFQEIVDLSLQAAQRTIGNGEVLDEDTLRKHVFHSVLHITAVSEDAVSPSLNDRQRALQIGRSTKELVEERLEADELPTVVEICTELGISERTLQYAVREYVGLTPVAYLRMCRLNHVRRMLAASDPETTTITRVAMRFGFLHLGRFAGDYKRVFGETPSETLNS